MKLGKNGEIDLEMTVNNYFGHYKGLLKNACSGGTWKYETSSWKRFGLKTYLSIVNI